MGIAAVSSIVVISIACIVLLTSRWKLNAFISLFLVSLFLAIAVMPHKDVVTIMSEGFGATMASTGFLVIFGAIIAIVIDKTGAAITLARYVLSKTGERNAAAALGITGFVAGMCIFCDSGFIILSGLAKSFSAKSKIAMPFIAGVLGCSLYAVHCLLPTHPGSLAAAGILDVNIGNLILLGIVFALPAVFAAYYWIRWKTKGKNYPAASERVDNAMKSEQNLPSVLLSFLPIAIPLALIAVASLLKIMNIDKANIAVNIFVFMGQPAIALLTGVAFSLLLLQGKKMEIINEVFENAIEKAGPILVVTAAGGMFGMIIKQTGVGTFAGLALSKTGLGLVIPFGIALILKTAQGSSTVAIITAASIVAPMLPALALDSESGKLFTMLAMGAGSMMVSHANDSYFWVITRFSDIHADVTLRIFSTATIVMGITSFVCVWIASFFLL
jgi:GntP family gluconate:H+ symporter